MHRWGEMARDGHVPHSEDTSHRLAVCNMDWDRLSANDIFGEWQLNAPEQTTCRQWDGFPLDLGLVVEDRPTEFSYTYNHILLSYRLHHNMHYRSPNFCAE